MRRATSVGRGRGAGRLPGQPGRSADHRAAAPGRRRRAPRRRACTCCRRPTRDPPRHRRVLTTPEAVVHDASAGTRCTSGTSAPSCSASATRSSAGRRDLDLVIASGGMLLDQLLGAGSVASGHVRALLEPGRPGPAWNFRRSAKAGDRGHDVAPAQPRPAHRRAHRRRLGRAVHAGRGDCPAPGTPTRTGRPACTASGRPSATRGGAPRRRTWRSCTSTRRRGRQRPRPGADRGGVGRRPGGAAGRGGCRGGRARRLCRAAGRRSRAPGRRRGAPSRSGARTAPSDATTATSRPTSANARGERHPDGFAAWLDTALARIGMAEV